MASRGSVIPLFIEQIREGKPLSITDPNMTRFMMTLGDAVDLVLYAFEHGANGDIFVNDAFSAAHRAHASTEGLAHKLPAFAGRTMQAELQALGFEVFNPFGVAKSA